MSNLKHQSPEELRGLISWCETKSATLAEQKKLKLALIEQLQQEVLSLGHQIHNIGQKEAWARIYLARKQLGLEERND